MKKMSFILPVIILSLAILLASCASPRDQLIGKWLVDSSADLQAQGLGNLVFEFTRDGLMNISISGSTLQFLYSVKYEFVNDHSIRFVNDTNLASSLAGQVAEFAIDGEKLTLTNNGEAQTFTRIPETQPTTNP
jgi:hypothetical protein